MFNTDIDSTYPNGFDFGNIDLPDPLIPNTPYP